MENAEATKELNERYQREGDEARARLVGETRPLFWVLLFSSPSDNQTSKTAFH